MVVRRNWPKVARPLSIFLALVGLVGGAWWITILQGNHPDMILLCGFGGGLLVYGALWLLLRVRVKNVRPLTPLVSVQATTRDDVDPEAGAEENLPNRYRRWYDNLRNRGRVRSRLHGKAARRRQTSRLDSDTDELALDESIADVLPRVWELLEYYSDSAYSVLADMLIEPATYRQRVVESVELTRGQGRKSVDMHLVVGSESRAKISDVDRLLIPLMQPKKGRLYDNLVISEERGNNVRSLPHDDAALVFVGVLLGLFRDSYGLDVDWKAWKENYKAAFRRLIALVLGSAWYLKVAGRANSAPNISAREAGVRVAHAELETILTGLGEQEDTDAGSQLARLAAVGVANYLIVVEASPADHFDFRYSYTLPTAALQREAHPLESSRLTRAVQNLLSLPSGYLEVSMTRARHAKSYHLYAQAPPGSYFGPTYSFLGEAAIEINPRRRYATGQPYLRPPQLSGSTAHIYGRSIGEAVKDVKDRRLTLRARIGERPYGTELFAALGSVSLILIAVILSRVSRNPEPDTDVVVALLAFPATLAGLAVFFSSTLRRSLIVSIGGLGLSFLATALSAVLMATFALELTTARPGSGASGAWLHFWDCAIVVAAETAIVACAAFIIRTIRYKQSHHRMALE